VLELYQRQKGKTPQALVDKPDLPWYFDTLLRSFLVLSSRRRFSYIKIEKSVNKKTYIEIKAIPSPIDISTILSYNDDIVGAKAEDYLDLILILDDMFLANYRTKNGS